MRSQFYACSSEQISNFHPEEVNSSIRAILLMERVILHCHCPVGEAQWKGNGQKMEFWLLWNTLFLLFLFFQALWTLE